MKGWKLYLTITLVAVVASAVTLMVNPRLLPVLAGSGTYTLTGKVSCVNSLVSGIWVETGSAAKGFAKLEEVKVADGWGWQRYSKTDMPKGAAFALHVGCGQKLFSKDWAMEARSDLFTAERLDLACNDVHPVLEVLGVASFKRVFPLLKAVGKKDFIEVPYEKCVEVPQNAALAPKVNVAPAVPLTQAPIATVPTLAPVPLPAKTSAPPPPPGPKPQPSGPVNAYDNYGTVTTPGIPMCRGNPGSALSMPGGVVSQTFVVPPGVRTLTAAKIQIDPAPGQVFAHLRILVNGALKAEAEATTNGDTHFQFTPVAVASGQQVQFSVSFRATAGKLITVYTVGGGRGTLSFSNTCPDGAPNYSTGSTALRAVISGWS